MWGQKDNPLGELDMISQREGTEMTDSNQGNK